MQGEHILSITHLLDMYCVRYKVKIRLASSAPPFLQSLYAKPGQYKGPTVAFAAVSSVACNNCRTTSGPQAQHGTSCCSFSEQEKGEAMLTVCMQVVILGVCA